MYNDDVLGSKMSDMLFETTCNGITYLPNLITYLPEVVTKLTCFMYFIIICCKIMYINYFHFSTLLELLKRREKSKKELLQLTIEILEKR